MKKNILISGVFLVLIFGIFMAGVKILTSENNKNVVDAKEITNPVPEKEAVEPPATVKEESTTPSVIAIKPRKKPKKSKVAKKLKEAKKPKKKLKKASKKQKKEKLDEEYPYLSNMKNEKNEIDRYTSTLTPEEKAAFEKKNKNKKKKVKVTEETVPDKFEVQDQGNIVKVYYPVVKDKDGKVIQEADYKKSKVNDWNEILKSAIYDENGKLPDFSDAGRKKHKAKEMGITVEEVEKLYKEGYFKNGDYEDGVTGYVGDGSPEDDAGMDFE